MKRGKENRTRCLETRNLINITVTRTIRQHVIWHSSATECLLFFVYILCLHPFQHTTTKSPPVGYCTTYQARDIFVVATIRQARPSIHRQHVFELIWVELSLFYLFIHTQCTRANV